MDTFSPKERSAIMRLVKSEDTTPELAVRKLVHALGYRYRLHRRDLPGCPDLVFPARRKVVFVHGCFWHWHGCKRSRMPKSNESYWRAKIDRNVQRDAENLKLLKGQGWRVLVVWECQIKNAKRLAKKLSSFLDKS